MKYNICVDNNIETDWDALLFFLIFERAAFNRKLRHGRGYNGSFKIKAVVTTREYKKAMKSLRNLKSIINTERFSNLNIRIKEQTRKMRLREISIDFHEKIVSDDNTPQMNVTKDRLTSSLIE